MSCMARLPELLTAQEVAQALRVDPATVRRWANDGTLPSIRVGRGWRFRADDVAAFATPVIPAGDAA